MKRTSRPLAQRGKNTVVAAMLAAVIVMAFVCLFVGSSNMSLGDAFAALAKRAARQQPHHLEHPHPARPRRGNRGAGLSASGLVMQTNLNNPMASPSTLGVSNAAVFGANLDNRLLRRFPLHGEQRHEFRRWGKPLRHLADGLHLLHAFDPADPRPVPDAIVLAERRRARGARGRRGVDGGDDDTQFYATDVGLSAAVIWNFGDLGRATYRTDAISLAAVAAGLIIFRRLMALQRPPLSGDASAKSMGVNADALRFVSMLAASVITAVCVSFLGVIGFVGVICPHVTKKAARAGSPLPIPVSALCGSLPLLLADTLAQYGQLARHCRSAR